MIFLNGYAAEGSAPGVFDEGALLGRGKGLGVSGRGNGQGVGAGLKDQEGEAGGKGKNEGGGELGHDGIMYCCDSL